MPDPGVCSTQLRSLSPCQNSEGVGSCKSPRVCSSPTANALYKGFLKSKGEVGEVVDYEAIQTEADARFREVAVERGAIHFIRLTRRSLL